MHTLLLLSLLLVAAPAHATTCTAASGATRTSLLELYTSEGCSSCPPADRWLSQLPAASGMVPLAFHVDYWDRLGWKDPFAQAAFSERQRARNSRMGWVYTPQVMLDGADLRNWHRDRTPRVKAAPAQADLVLKLTRTAGHIDAQLDSRIAAPTAGQPAQRFLALYENRLVSTVAAGENARRTLHHDYVVRQLAGPFDSSRARHRFMLEADWKASDLGVAAFVLNAQGDTLQALALSACP